MLLFSKILYFKKNVDYKLIQTNWTHKVYADPWYFPNKTSNCSGSAAATSPVYCPRGMNLLANSSQHDPSNLMASHFPDTHMLTVPVNTGLCALSQSGVVRLVVLLTSGWAAKAPQFWVLYSVFTLRIRLTHNLSGPCCLESSAQVSFSKQKTVDRSITEVLPWPLLFWVASKVTVASVLHWASFPWSFLPSTTPFLSFHFSHLFLAPLEWTEGLPSPTAPCPSFLFRSFLFRSFLKWPFFCRAHKYWPSKSSQSWEESEKWWSLF